MDDREEDRRLAVILAADLVGFSSAAEKNEDVALARADHRLSLLETTIEHYGGRIFHRAGDGRFAAFHSARRAVRAAVETQASLNDKVRAEGLPLRIGIYVSEVFENANGDLLGHGVNVAARLEAAAPPGGILVSKNVWEFAGAPNFGETGECRRIRLAKMEMEVEAWPVFPKNSPFFNRNPTTSRRRRRGL
jgi:adenylate cyclase